MENSLIAQFNAGRAGTQALPLDVAPGASQLDSRAQSAYMMGNSLQPRQVAGQNVTLNPFRQAEDIRRNEENNRLDLRANMNNQASAEQGRLQREFMGTQGDLNRKATAAQTKAQIESNELMQNALFRSQATLQESEQDHQMAMQENRNSFSLAQTKEELDERIRQFDLNYDLEKEKIKKTYEGRDKDRMVALDELNWKKFLAEKEHKLNSDKFEQQKTDREAFGKNVGEVINEYNKWKSTGMNAMRERLKKEWISSYGLSFEAQNPGLFKKTDATGTKTIQIKMRSGYAKKINQEWIDTVMRNLDGIYLDSFQREVNGVVNRRDAEFSTTMSSFLRTASGGGIPISIPPNALQPPQSPSASTPSSGSPQISPGTQKYFKP